jgi:hypothetical protein
VAAALEQQHSGGARQRRRGARLPHAGKRVTGSSPHATRRERHGTRSRCRAAEAVAHLERAFSALERSGVEATIDLYLDRGRANETLGEFRRSDNDFTAALARARSASDVGAEWRRFTALGMLWAARDTPKPASFGARH